MSRTLTEIRKDIDHDTCSDVRSLLDILRRIARNNPEAYNEAIRSKYTFGRGDVMSDDKVEQMATYNLDKIVMLLETFNNR